MSVRRKPYPEVLENLLTAVTRGVAAEDHPFPPAEGASAPHRYSLNQPPVASVVAVRGSRGGESHLFRAEGDYTLADEETLEWLEGGELPDPGTLFQVSYYPQSSQPVLTDIQTGSVLRTLLESVGLEMARLSAQLHATYESGFVDTATGRSLERVVALLGISRIEAGRAAGEVEFRRAEGLRGAINLPPGTRVLSQDGAVEYETTAAVTLAEGQQTVRVGARDLEANDPVAADTLTVLPVPIAGVATVTNPAPTAFANRDESDGELRQRAKSFLHGSEKATLGALHNALAHQGIQAEVEELGDGRVRVTPQAEQLDPEVRERLFRALEEVRPVGVLVELDDPRAPRKVRLRILLHTSDGLLPEDLRRLQLEVRSKVEAYFADLPSAAPGSVNRLVGLVLSVSGVEDMDLVEAAWEVDGEEVLLDTGDGTLPVGGHPTVLGELDLADPRLPTLLDVVVVFPQGEAPPDRPSIQNALTTALDELNTLNAEAIAAGLPAEEEALERGRRSVTYGKLLLAMPLPGHAAVSIADQDAATAAGTPLALPALGDTTVEFVLTQPSGLSLRLAAPEEAYALSPFERLGLNEVEVEESE